MESGGFRAQIRRLEPRIAENLPPGWFTASTWPEFRSDIAHVDSATFGDVIMGQWYILFYGGFARQHCGSPPMLGRYGRCRALTGWQDFGSPTDPIGAKRTRTIADTTGTALSGALDPPYSVYGGDSHLPFPNTPAVRGIGIRWPQTKQGMSLTTLQRDVVFGGAYQMVDRPGINRHRAESRAVRTHPLCLYRHVIWGAANCCLNGVIDMRMEMDLQQSRHGRAAGTTVTFPVPSTVDTSPNADYPISGQRMVTAAEFPQV